VSSQRHASVISPREGGGGIRYPLNMRVSGSQNRSGYYGGEKNRLLYVHFVNLTMQYGYNVKFIFWADTRTNLM